MSFCGGVPLNCSHVALFCQNWHFCITSSVSDSANFWVCRDFWVLFFYTMRRSAPLTVPRDPFTDPGQPTTTVREFTQQEAIEADRVVKTVFWVARRANRKFRVSTAVEMFWQRWVCALLRVTSVLEQLEDTVTEQPRVYVDVWGLPVFTVRSICYGSVP